MVEHTSERRRLGRPREGDDLARTLREAEGDGEVHEHRLGIREVSEVGGSVEHRLEAALRDLEAREGREKTISQRLREAFDDLERREQRKESTEAKLREALESIKDDEGTVQLTLEAAVQSGRPVTGLSKNDMREGSDIDLRHRTEDVERPSQEIPKEVSEHNPEAPASPQRGDSHVPHVKFESMEEIDKAILQHTHMEDGLSPENYEKCRQYIRVISEKDTGSSKEIAERENLDERVVNKWREGRGPSPIHVIENLEFQRLEHEQSIPEEALKHRIESDQVRELTGRLRESEKHTIKELVDIVDGLHNRIEGARLGSVHYAELYDTQTPLLKDGLRDIALEIRANRDVIQSELNVRLGLDGSSDHEVRIGVTDSRLYYWHINTSPDLWVNVLADQKFYMSKADKIRLIDEMRAHLHIRGGGQTSEYYLNDLVNQLSGLESHAGNRIGRYYDVHSLDGEVMHLIGDLKGKTIEDFKPVINHMGTKEAARVYHPKFPDIHEYRMKFVAIIESDGHLDGEGRLTYYEKNKERQKIAVGIFQEFGNFEVKVMKEDGIQVNLPRLLGSMADYWGIPRGDRAIHNKGLDESIINETLETKTHYLRQMVPEDGSISRDDVSVTRHLVLHAGKRMEKYREAFGIEPLVNHDHIEFVCEHGIPQPAYLCYNAGDVIKLYISTLEELATEQEYSKTARDLIQIIDKNDHRLLDDEVNRILRPLGIQMKDSPRFVLYYRTSGRLAVCYPACTQTKNDAIRWVLIAPPEHPSKMDAAIKLVKSNLNRSKQIAMQIEEDGLHIHRTWEEYLH